jgi:DMSO reductase anchor subunit
MIYRSLKPIQRWCNGWTAPNYLLLGLMSGALILQALLACHGHVPAGITLLALAAIVAAALAKLGYWRFIDRTRSASTAESATGLGRIGKVRLLESPHSGDSYLLREMGFRVARKHAAKLRRIAVVLAFLVPLALLVVAWLAGGTVAAAASVAGALSSLAGVAVERWLFFAEARHAVTLYYGADAA